LLDTYYEIQNKEQFNHNIQKIISTIDIITKLLDNILFLDEIKVHTLSLTMVEIYQFIHIVKEETIIRYNAKQKIIVNTNASKELMISTDEKLFNLIISNLLSNAIKYSPDDTEIIVEFEDRKDDFIIMVQDFGHGIPDDVVEHLFDTFIRSQSVTNISGSGIGLSITQNCVDILKGEIKFETKKNVGTKFTVRLPKLNEEKHYIDNE
jgi:signal transduction histidine kinase